MIELKLRAARDVKKVSRRTALARRSNGIPDIINGVDYRRALITHYLKSRATIAHLERSTS